MIQTGNELIRLDYCWREADPIIFKLSVPDRTGASLAGQFRQTVDNRLFWINIFDLDLQGVLTLNC